MSSKYVEGDSPIPPNGTVLALSLAVMAPLIVGITLVSVPSTVGLQSGYAVGIGTWVMFSCLVVGRYAVEGTLLEAAFRRWRLVGVLALPVVVGLAGMAVVASVSVTGVLVFTVVYPLFYTVTSVESGVVLLVAIVITPIVGIFFLSLGLLLLIAGPYLLQFIPAAMILENAPPRQAVHRNWTVVRGNPRLIASFDALVLIALAVVAFPAGLLQILLGESHSALIPSELVPVWLLLSGTVALAVLSPMYVGLYHTLSGET